MKILKILLFVAGVVLLGINISGLFKSLRNEELYSEITPYRDDISIRFSEAKKALARQKNESDKDFALRVNMIINNAMAHYWKDEGTGKYNMLIPIWENYILRFRQEVTDKKKYEFRNYRKAIERGVGICSQPCIALQDLLNHDGIEADLWDIKGHVVVEAKFSDGTHYTLDPDYGQYVPLGMDAIQANPELVREAYKDQDEVYASHVKEHKHTDDIVKMYEKDGNHIYNMGKSFEDFSYMAKWLLPLLLMLPYLLSLVKRKW